MTVLALGSDWLVTGGDHAGAHGVGMVAHYPAMQRSCTVVWHPEQCSIGVATFEGDPRHATTLLERKLRSQGEISADVKILILQSLKVGRGYQVLYVTVPLDEWQHMLSWSASQRHICRLTLAAGMAFKQVDSGRAVVLQVGRHFHFFARHDGQLVHLQAVSVDDAVADLQAVAAMLGAQAREDMTARGCDQLSVIWLPAAFKGEGSELDSISSAFADAANVPVEQRGERLGNLASLAVSVYSALPGVIQRIAPKDLLNQSDDRMHVLAREYLPIGAMVAMALAAVLSYVAYGWVAEASAVRQQALVLQADESGVRNSIAVVARDTAVERPAVNRQVETLASFRKVQRDHDPVHLLDALKQGSQGGIRILSVTSELPAATSGALKQPAPPSVVVDGTLPDNVINSDLDTRSLSTFVKTLADHGYTAEPIDVRSASSGHGASTRLFSYRVTRIESVEGRKS
jgi:hypothetical protein